MLFKEKEEESFSILEHNFEAYTNNNCTNIEIEDSQQSTNMQKFQNYGNQLFKSKIPSAVHHNSSNNNNKKKLFSTLTSSNFNYNSQQPIKHMKKDSGYQPLN